MDNVSSARWLLHPHDTYQSEPTFKGFHEGEFSTYDSIIDSQASVPIENINILKKELSCIS